MTYEKKVDMVWAMMSVYEPMQKMVDMTGISELEIYEIARENNFDYSYL